MGVQRRVDEGARPEGGFAAELNLRGVLCPLNFVKTKIALERVGAGARVCIELDPGEPERNVSRSAELEGHAIESREALADGAIRFVIRKKSG